MHSEPFGMSHELAGSPVVPELRPWVARAVRVGYVGKGLIYLLIGALAFRLAAGLRGGRLMDPAGALLVLMRQPFGQAVVATLGIAILAYSAWQFVAAIWDTRRKGRGWKGWMGRAVTMIKGGAYGTVGWQALRLVTGMRAASANPREVAADVLTVPLGDVLLFLVGAGVAVYGFFELRDAVGLRFGDDLDEHRFKREIGSWAVAIGSFGNAARAVLLMMIGVALITAAVQREPHEAGGVAHALAALFSQPYGIVLAGVVAAGLTCFGLFQLMHARYARL
jgi:Domain of Unknown Function (DUF1206)